MRRTRVVVIGAGGQAKIVVDALLLDEFCEFVGYVDDRLEVGAEWFGFPVLGPEAALADLRAEHGIEGGIVSVGDNYVRGQVVERVTKAVEGFRWINAIHPSVSIARGCRIGEGVLMMASAVVNPDSTVGDHASIDTRASLDHDSILGRCASLAPNVATGGGCTIGDFTAVSIGTAVAHGRTIGAHTVIGAGSVVIRDIPDHVVAYGAPARVIRPRREGEPYLHQSVPE